MMSCAKGGIFYDEGEGVVRKKVILHNMGVGGVKDRAIFYDKIV